MSFWGKWLRAASHLPWMLRKWQITSRMFLRNWGALWGHSSHQINWLKIHLSIQVIFNLMFKFSYFPFAVKEYSSGFSRGLLHFVLGLSLKRIFGLRFVEFSAKTASCGGPSTPNVCKLMTMVHQLGREVLMGLAVYCVPWMINMLGNLSCSVRTGCMKQTQISSFIWWLIWTIVSKHSLSSGIVE